MKPLQITMYCKKVSIRDFRNIAEQEIEFCDGVNVISGETAQGKTNLLESIYYVSVGKSFRANHNGEIIRFGCERSQVDLTFNDGIRDQNIKMTIFKEKKRQAEKNGVRIDKLSDIVGCFRTVLFCPEHLSIVKEGPAVRRNYLDIAISRQRPMYLHALQKYNLILKQRNQLIKNAISDRQTFDTTVDLWSEQLAHEAAVIAKFRAEFIKKVDEHVKSAFYEMCGDRELPEISYESSSRLSAEEVLDVKATEKRYAELLLSNHEREIYAGATLYGAHKDDMAVSLNGKTARIFASQGQQRSIAIALKLAEGEICREEFGDYPVFLFDDVLSELDAKRRDYLINRIKNKQVIITCCDKNEIKEAKKITVRDGSYLF